MTDDLIRKIRGLLATAESLAESGHEEAAGAYIAKAHALQQKHSIDAALLDDAAGDNGNGKAGPAVVTRTWAVPGRYGRRKVDLAHTVSRRTGCTGYFRSDDGAYQFTLFGFPQDVEWAETLFLSLCHQAEAALAVAARAVQRDGDRAEHGRSFATSFLAGFTATVDRRLKEAAAEAEAAARAEQPAGTASVAVVLAGKAARVESEMRASVKGLRTTRSNGGTSSSGYRRGQTAGQRATLARGSVDGRPQPALGGR